MKTKIKLFGIIALVAVIGFTMAACAASGNTVLTYKGINGGYEWTLKIIGDVYELNKGEFNTSHGDVTQKQGTTYYLKPSVTATLFTATVSSAGLVELQGTIVWYAGGMPEALPGQLNPTGGTGGGGGGIDQPNTPGGGINQPNNPVGGGSGNGVGCHDLSPGTKCSANSICNNNFLCLTGQGSDNNCTTGCSCQ